MQALTNEGSSQRNYNINIILPTNLNFMFGNKKPHH